MRESKSNIRLYVALLAVLMATILLQGFNIFADVENLVYDNFFLEREPVDSIVIVTIEDSSLQEYGAWPWNREIFSRLVHKLDKAGARVAAFDIIFSESRNGEAKLEESVTEANLKTVFAGKILSSSEYLHPLPALTEPASSETAFANFQADFDGKVRNAKLYQSVSEDCYLSLAQMSVSLYVSSRELDVCGNKNLVSGFSSYNVDDNNSIRINFAGAAGTFPQYLIQDVIEGNVDESVFKDKLVFIGSNIQDIKSDLQDNLINPLDGQIIAGVELHANVANTILGGDFIYPVSSLIQVLSLVLVAGISYFFNKKLSTLPSFLVTMAVLIAYILFVALMFGLGVLFEFLAVPIILVSFWIIENFWQYYLKRQENQEIRKAFGQYVNDHLLSEILNEPNKLTLGGDAKEMSVLFSDIRGFTSISESMEPEELVEFLNNYLTDVTQVILDNDGVVDKFIGDAVMALWGAPIENKNHSYSSCVAALAMLEALNAFNVKKKADLPEIKIGIGINSGKMIVGNMGSAQRFDYSVLGDNVNLASRLEGLTKQYGADILLGENTVADLKKAEKIDEFKLRQIDSVTVKGKKKATKLYQLMPHDTDEKLLKNFAIAYKKYTRGEFKEAADLFKKLQRQYEDKTSQIMLERVNELIKNPPEKWEGVWNWTTK